MARSHMIVGLRAELLSRYETSAGEYHVAGEDIEFPGLGWKHVRTLPRAIPHELARRIDADSLDIGDPVAYRCRRCLAVNGLDNGSDDMGGLCDDCWCGVDEKRERWGLG